jgi:hypothetical protein
MPNVASEARVAERFAAWLSQVTGRKHTVSPGGDPPDFIMELEGWLEVSGIYLRDEQAKFLNCAAERSFGFSGPLDETALRLIRKLDEKLGKQSYQAAYTQRGKGTLLLSCQDCFFDGVNLARIREAFASFRPTNDRGFSRQHTLSISYLVRRRFLTICPNRSRANPTGRTRFGMPSKRYRNCLNISWPSSNDEFKSVLIPLCLKAQRTELVFASSS